MICGRHRLRKLPKNRRYYLGPTLYFFARYLLSLVHRGRDRRIRSQAQKVLSLLGLGLSLIIPALFGNKQVNNANTSNEVRDLAVAFCL